MNHMNAAECRELVHRTSLRLYRKYSVARASLDFDDFEQEMWLEWMKVKDRFDPQSGYEFTTFYGTCCRNKTIKIVKRGRVQTNEMTPAREQTTMSHDASVEEVITGRQVSRAIQDKMNDMDERVRAMVQYLIEEPEILKREAMALASKSALASGSGKGQDKPAEITLPMLFKLFGISKARGYRLLAQLKEEIDELQQ